jgi:hypothetical protein
MVTSKLKGCAYKDCPLCGVATNIESYVKGLEGRIESVYDTLSQRNEMIHDLQEKIILLQRELVVARGVN